MFYINKEEKADLGMLSTNAEWIGISWQAFCLTPPLTIPKDSRESIDICLKKQPIPFKL